MHDGKLWLHRKVLDSDLWTLTPRCIIVAFICLIRANWEDRMVRGMLVKRGQWLTHRSEILSLCPRGMTERMVRRALERLKKRSFLCTEVGRQGGRRWLLITICKYNAYQEPLTERGRQRGIKGADGGPDINRISKEQKESTIDSCPIAEEFLALWNRYPKEPMLDRLTEKRRREIAAKAKDKDFAAKWRDALVAFREATWKANFRWFMAGDNWLNALEQRAAPPPKRPVIPSKPKAKPEEFLPASDIGKESADAKPNQ